MSDERSKDIVPLPQSSQLVPEFVEAVKAIQKGREKIEDTERSPEYIRHMLENSSEWLNPYMLIYYLDLARENHEGRSLVHTSWQSVNQIFTDSLGLEDDFNHTPSSVVSQAVKDQHKDDLQGVVMSRNIVLSITRQQFQDKEITEERAVELAIELVRATVAENIAVLYDAPSVEHISANHEAAIAIQCVSALDIAYSADPDSEMTKSLKEACYFALDLIVQRQAIKQNWYIMDMEDGPKKGSAAKELMDAMSQQMDHLTWVAENSDSKIDRANYFEAIGQTLKTYGRAVHFSYSCGAISKEEYIEAVNRMVKMTWEIMGKKYERKDEVIDGYHTLITRSGEQMFAMAYLAPWNSDQKKLIQDMIDQQSEDKYYPMTLYGFFGSLAQLGWCDKETMEFLKTLSFLRREEKTEPEKPTLPSTSPR